MKVAVTAFVNSLMESNCYILERLDRVIIVDPGSDNVSHITEYLNVIGGQVDYVILTHEHIDHVQGARPLSEMYGIPVICTCECLKSLNNPCLNLSASYPEAEPCDYTPPFSVTIESIGNELMWNGVKIKFYSTPGHCSGAMCFEVDNILFTGDTLLERIKTYTTSPSSSLEQLSESLKMIRNEFCEDLLVYPGHGTSFKLGDVFSFVDTQIRLISRKIERSKK